MREDVRLVYHCDGEDCHEKAIVQEEDGRWIGEDLAGRKIILRECGLPFPATWTNVGGSHFCPNHRLVVHGGGSADQRPVTGKDVEIIMTGGLYSLEKS